MSEQGSTKGLKWNRTYELICWGVTGLIILLPLLIHGDRFVAPSFLTFMGLIILTGLGLWLFHITESKGAEQDGLGDKTEFFTRLVSFMVGGLFIVSGFVKLQDTLGFSYKLDEYWHVFGVEFMVPLSLPLAWFISVFEVALAVALMTGFRMKLTIWPLMGMLVFFTFLTGFSAITGKVTDCGCFGDALKLTPWQTFIKDIILVVFTLPIFLNRDKIKPLYEGMVPGIATAAVFAIFGIFSYWTLQHLPVMDFRTAYKIGQNLDYNWQNFNDHDEIIAHDFVPFGAPIGNCEEKDFVGKTVYIIMYDMDETDKDALKATVAWSQDLKAAGIQVIGATASLSDDRNAYIKEYGIPYCIAGADQTVLKTMIRANPGIMAMKDGIILGKWHHNNMPSVDEISKVLQ